MEGAVSSKGKPLLHYEGHTYYRRRTLRATANWMCTGYYRQGCKGRAVSDLETGRVTVTVQHSCSGGRLHCFSTVPQGGVGSLGAGPVAGQGSPGPTKKPPAASPVPPAPAPAAAPPEVCLRWNSYHSNMQATFPSLLNNEQFVDVTLACDGRSIKCHKVMLSACSSYFEELLSQNPCQHPIVVMRDLKFWEVQALVEFMYTGEVNVAQDKLPSLLSAAEALQIKGLTSSSSSSSGGSSYQQEEESNSAGGFVGSTSGLNDHDDMAVYQQPAKRPRKRKPANPVPYQHKPQMMYSGLSEEASRVALSQGGGTPGRASPLCLVQPARHAALSPKVRHDSPAHLPPPHPPFGLNAVKNEPDDSYDTCLDLSECDSTRKDSGPPTLNLSTSMNQSPSIQGRVSVTNGTSSPGPAPSLPTNLCVKREPPPSNAIPCNTSSVPGNPGPVPGNTGILPGNPGNAPPGNAGVLPGNTSLSEEEEHSSECSEPHPLDPNQDL